MSGVSGRGEEEVEQDVEVGEHEGEEWMIVQDRPICMTNLELEWVTD